MKTAQLSATVQGRLGYLPVALFGSVMGLTGLALAWRSAHEQFGLPLWVAYSLGALALLAFIVQTAAYAIKASTDFSSVLAEFRHPVSGSLFGTPIISLLLLPMILARVNLALARAAWIIGTVAMMVFAWWIVVHWIVERQKPVQATPAWIVPVVGLIEIPLAVPALGWADTLHGLMIFGTAVGLFFAIPLFTMILTRLMFEEPIPDAAQPVLMIMVAPFAVGFSAYVTTTGTVDAFADALYMLTLFMLAVLMGRLRHLPMCCPFRVSWWAVSFPLAASALASLRYAGHARNFVSEIIALALLAFATLVIAGLAAKTIAGIVHGELRALSN